MFLNFYCPLHKVKILNIYILKLIFIQIIESCRSISRTLLMVRWSVRRRGSVQDALFSWAEDKIIISVCWIRRDVLDFQLNFICYKENNIFVFPDLTNMKTVTSLKSEIPVLSISLIFMNWEKRGTSVAIIFYLKI